MRIVGICQVNYRRKSITKKCEKDIEKEVCGANMYDFKFGYNL